MSALPPSTEPVSDVRVTIAGTQQEEHREVPPSPRYILIDTQANTVTTVSSGSTTLLSQSQNVEREFRLLAERWYLDTMPLSSYVEKILHPSYQKILVLGRRVVPLIMNELRDMPNDWFWALRMLTEVDPVASDQAGDMQAMANAWLSWWENEGSNWQAQNLS